MRCKWILCTALAAALMVGTAVTAFAAETETEAEENASSYGYLAGQKRSADRRSRFAGANLESDQEREAFFRDADIGGQYADAQHLDAQALAEAGVIDQETADKIAEYASGKHVSIHSRYSADIAAMTPQERRAHFEGFEADELDGDTVEELLRAGVITQAQADAITAYLG